jgi:uncharacterized membrane protein YbhN (UPF0104 family)
MNSKTLRYFLLAIVFVLSYGFIIHKIVAFEEIKSFDLSTSFINPISLLIVLLVFILMFVNWAIEAIKWQKLVCKIQYFSFTDALKAVISGVTVGVFTPNRVGEIGGRIAFLEKGKRTSGALASGIGSFAQFIATIFMGLTGFIIFLFVFPEKTKINTTFNNLSAIFLFLLLACFIWSFFNVKRLIPLLTRIPFFKKRTDQLGLLSLESGKFLLIILILSTLRYVVFFLQFFLLLIVFDVKLTLIEGFVSITLTYLFMTIIPTTTLIELGLRGSLAIFFIGIFSQQVLGIVLASFFIWIINIAIPAIIGSFLLINPKIKQTIPV